VTAADWATVASLATALGTLVLAVATFSAVRSGNRTARAAELSLLTTLRPLLTPSRRTDSPLKVNFGDSKWLRVPGSSGAAEMGGGDGTMGPADAVLYFALSLRNPDDPQYEMGRKVIEGHGEWVVDLLYGDEDGGQRVIGRFRCQPTPWTVPGIPRRRRNRRGWRARGRRPARAGRRTGATRTAPPARWPAIRSIPSGR